MGLQKRIFIRGDSLGKIYRREVLEQKRRQIRESNGIQVEDRVLKRFGEWKVIGLYGNCKQFSKVRYLIRLQRDRGVKGEEDEYVGIEYIAECIISKDKGVDFYFVVLGSY